MSNNNNLFFPDAAAPAVHTGDRAPETEPERQYYFMEKTRELLERQGYSGNDALTFHVTTFGCQMNARDSEKLRGILQYVGMRESESEECDLVLFNTCTVRENANLKVYGRLGELHGYKKKNPRMKIGICGCMMQEKSEVEKVKKSYPFVDIVFGTHNLYRFAELLYRSFVGEKRVVDVEEADPAIVENLPIERKYPFKSGVNVTFGCNNFCSYCIVPYVRGREKSRAPQDILREIENLAKDGVKEIMLLGQNVNSYGKTLETPVSFAELLSEVEKIDGIERIRFMTSHPKDLSDDLIEVMAQSKKICRHIHLPLQAGSTRVLAEMNRHYTKEDYLRLCDKIRTAMPDIAITTDIMVGFPGETEEEFLETLDVVKKVQYDSAFTFIYSPREGTPAAAREDFVPEEVVHERFDRLLNLIHECSASQAKKHVGEIQEVLVEEVNSHDPSLVTGHMGNNSLVHFAGSPDLIGQTVPVKLTESHDFYYFGEALHDE